MTIRLLPPAFDLLLDIEQYPMGEWMLLYLIPSARRAFHVALRDRLIVRQWDEAVQGYVYAITDEGRAMIAVSKNAPWNAATGDKDTPS